MIISVKTDLEALGYNLDALSTGVQEAIKIQVGQLAAAARGEWIRLAQSRLSTSREEYIAGLRRAESFKRYSRGTTDVYEITLVGQFPNDLEFGRGSFDMKSVRPGWLGGKKAKPTKDGGSYVTIPFRHSTSNSPRFNYTGKAAKIDDPTLKQQLRTTVKEYGLDRMVRTATGKVVAGNVQSLGGKLNYGTGPGQIHPYLKGLTRYQQPMSGMVGGKQRGTGQLMTFRRMSTNSKPDSWIHPGLDAANLLGDVQSFIDKEIIEIGRKVIGV